MRYSVVLNWEDEPPGWTAHVPALHVATCGDTVDEALDMARELIALAVDGMREDGELVPVETVPPQVHVLDVTEDEIASVIAASTTF